MKRWLVLLMLLIQAVFAVGAEAAIQVPPKPSVSSGIYVQDYAGVYHRRPVRPLMPSDRIWIIKPPHRSP